MGPGIGIIIFVLAVLLVLFIGSALVRAGVAIANRVIGRVKVEKPIGWDWDAEEDEEDYEELYGGGQREEAMPEPGIAQGMVIVLLAALAQLILGFLLAFVIDPDEFDGGARVVAHLIGTAAGFLTMTGLLASMLPTTPKRAALASLFTYLVVVVIAVVVFVLLSLVAR